MTRLTTTQTVRGPDAAFTATSTTDGENSRLALRGELDAATHSILERELVSLETAPGRVISVDLAGLRFVDSRGVAMLLGAAQRAAADERTFVLLNPCRSTSRLLDILSASYLVRPEASVRASAVPAALQPSVTNEAAFSAPIVTELDLVFRAGV